MTTPFAKPSPLNASTARIGYDNKTHYVDRRVAEWRPDLAKAMGL